MQVSTLDYAIIVLYLIGITAFGKIIGGKQKTVKDYFVGKKEVGESMQIWHLSYPDGEFRQVTTDTTDYASLSVSATLISFIFP